MKKLLLIPLFVLVVAIISSIVAFQQTKELNKGYLFLDGNMKEASYEGDYYLLVGNLGTESSTITMEEQTDGILISIYDVSDQIIKEYFLVVKKENQNYDPSIVTAVNLDDKIDIDNIDDSLLEVFLEKNQIYEFDVTKTNNHDNSDELDFVFINLPEHILNMKSIMESVAFTSSIFTIISIFTIVAIWYVKKE